MQDTTEEILADVSPDTNTEAQFAEKLLIRAVKIVESVNVFKAPRVRQIQKYRNMYAGNVPKKFRQPFNVVIPTFAGAMDTLMAAFNDDLGVELGPQEPADFIAAQKFQAVWDQELTSMKPNARFAYKARTDRSNALFSGRGFMTQFATSDPEFKMFFEVYELEDAIFQPYGGGHMENHLFSGRENVIRTESALKAGNYDKKQVQKLLEMAAKTEHEPPIAEANRDILQKYKAGGLNTAEGQYIGETTFRLTQMVLEVDGERWFFVFSPWYNIWLRCQRLEEVVSSEEMPFKSWATHDDNKNFLSKSYADDMYGIAEATHILVNQELVNREKQNHHARGYDVNMVKDVAKLDLAQHRPDALFPVEVPNGKNISEAIFEFKTAELSGTINLVDWMKEEMGLSIGVTDLNMGSVREVSKKASVVFAEQQSITKRLLLRSSPYTECMGEIASLFVTSCIDHMPASLAIRMLGANGMGWDQITRKDLKLSAGLDVRIVSSTIEMQNSQLKKEARSKALTTLATVPPPAFVNRDWWVEENLKTGEYDESEIAVAMDTKNFGNKVLVARAYQAIQEIIRGVTPKLYFNATTLFLEIIHNYAREHHDELPQQQYLKMMDYITAHAQIVQDNMTYKAQAEIAQGAATPAAPAGGAPAAPTDPAALDTTPKAPYTPPANLQQ